MTQFDKNLFSYDGLFLMYGKDATNKGTFIARFKRGGMAPFKSFLIKNFTVEEYLMAMEKSTPLQALEAKGYVSPQLKSALKSLGYEPNQFGKVAYLKSLSQAKS
jgi:hypothetical protein